MKEKKIAFGQMNCFSSPQEKFAIIFSIKQQYKSLYAESLHSLPFTTSLNRLFLCLDGCFFFSHSTTHQDKRLFALFFLIFFSHFAKLVGENFRNRFRCRKKKTQKSQPEFKRHTDGIDRVNVCRKNICKMFGRFYSFS